MEFHVHVDRPTGFLIKNLQQTFTGWLAAKEMPSEARLSFVVDGVQVEPTLYPRVDVEQVLPGMRAVGWTLHLDHRVLARSKRRTLELLIRCDQLEHRRYFFRCKELMHACNSSPLFFMHIPKTAGTALRQFVDYAFSGFPSLAIYGDYPGIVADQALDTYWDFTHRCELIFGHYAYDFAQTVHARNPKVVTIFRNPEDLVRSYANFNVDPNPVFLDNPLVRHVTGLGYDLPFGEVGPEHLNAALRIAERNLHVIPSSGLQDFANEISSTFAIPSFKVPKVNQNSQSGNGAREMTMPFDVRYDTALYEACVSRSTSFTDFLDY